MVPIKKNKHKNNCVVHMGYFFLQNFYKNAYHLYGVVKWCMFFQTIFKITTECIAIKIAKHQSVTQVLLDRLCSDWAQNLQNDKL